MVHERGSGSLSVVIVTYNSAAVLPGLLDSLAAGLRGIDPFEVIVVDNDSRDGSADLAMLHPICPKVIRTGRNAGYAAGINAAQAGIDLGSHVLILNPDVRLLPGSVLPLMERIQDPTVGVAVPRNLTPEGATNRTLRREPSLLTAWTEAVLGGRLAARLGLGEMIDDDSYEAGRSAEWASGCALLVSARARHLAPQWDETFFLYSEEVEYQRRVRDLGLTIAYVPQSRVAHLGGESHVDSRLWALMMVNRIRYYRRHHGPTAAAVFRLAVIVGEAIRAPAGAPHRAALRCALALPKAPAVPRIDFPAHAARTR